MADRKRQKHILIVIGIIILFVFFLWLVGRILSEPAAENVFFDTLPQDRPAVVAHRGGADLWPENTITAFRAARNVGVDAIELDIRVASDGTPVVIHDATVDRTTEGSGRVDSKTVEELQSLDAGYRFQSLEGSIGTPYREMGIRIPTLEQVLREFPDMPLFMEIKAQDRILVEEVVGLIGEYDREERTLVASEFGEVQEAVRDAIPEIATSAVQGEIAPFFIAHRFFVPGVYTPVSEAFLVPTSSGPFTVTTKRFIENAQRRNVYVGAFTINERDTMRTLIDRNIDAVITGRPDLMLELLGEL